MSLPAACPAWRRNSGASARVIALPSRSTCPALTAISAKPQSIGPAWNRTGHPTNAQSPVSRPSALWGGCSEYPYLHARSVFHPLPSNVPVPLGSMALPIGNGYHWASLHGQVSPDESTLILGPGQQGLACAVIAKEAGARKIILVGLERDVALLEVAQELGAHHNAYRNRGAARPCEGNRSHARRGPDNRHRCG